MKNIVFLLSILSLVSCKKENINLLRKKTTIHLTTTNAFTNKPLNDLSCQLVRTQHEVVSDDKVLSSATTENGEADLRFTHNAYNDYDLEVDVGSLILLNGNMPKIELGAQNQIDLYYSEKADLSVKLMNTSQDEIEGTIWFKITYDNYPAYKSSNGIPTEGRQYYCTGGTVNHDYSDIPAGNYTIEWKVTSNNVLYQESDHFTISPGENFTYELVY